jgi:hypothetical protein
VKICQLVKAAMGHTHMHTKHSHLASFFSLWERKYIENGYPIFLRFAQYLGAKMCSKWNKKSFSTILSAYSHVSLPGSNLDLVTSFPSFY